MIEPRQKQHDVVRLSMVSFITEDSVGLLTPNNAPSLRAPDNQSPIISTINDDPLPNIKSYPDTTHVNRRRAQTSPRPVPSPIIFQSIPQQRPTIISTLDNKKSFWPKITLFTHTSNNVSLKQRWFHKNRISPQ